jgi:hypothetical protein
VQTMLTVLTQTCSAVIEDRGKAEDVALTYLT